MNCATGQNPLLFEGIPQNSVINNVKFTISIIASDNKLAGMQRSRKIRPKIKKRTQWIETDPEMTEEVIWN